MNNGPSNLFLIVVNILLLLEHPRYKWLLKLFARLKTSSKTSKPRVMKPKSEKDCPHCRDAHASGGSQASVCRHSPIPGGEVRLSPPTLLFPVGDNLTLPPETLEEAIKIIDEHKAMFIKIQLVGRHGFLLVVFFSQKQLYPVSLADQPFHLLNCPFARNYANIIYCHMQSSKFMKSSKFSLEKTVFLGS